MAKLDIIDAGYETALEACRRATESIMPLWPNPSNERFDRSRAMERIEKGGVGNYATAADLDAERLIIETIQSNPTSRSHSIVTEEADNIQGDDEWRWIVDPIDGTMNFLNGIPDFGICVALFRGNDPVVGAIAMPALGQMVAMKQGGRPRLLSYDGAVVADLAAWTSHYDDTLENSIVGYNLGYHERPEQLTRIAEQLVDKVGYASCLGSFATGNFRLLQGTMGVYFGMAPTVMDLAPVALLIPAIGGVVTDLTGNPIDWRAEHLTYVGSINPRVHEQFLTALNA